MANGNGGTTYNQSSDASIQYLLSNGVISGTINNPGTNSATVTEAVYQVGFAPTGLTGHGSISSGTAGQYGAFVIGGGYTGSNLSAGSKGALLASGGILQNATASGTYAGIIALGGGQINGYSVGRGALILLGDQEGTNAGNILTSKGLTDLGGAGVASGGTVYAGGTETITSAGTDQNSLIHGSQFVSSGGSTVGTLVNSGGVQNLFSGSVALNSVIGSAGTEIVASGATATQTLASGGTVLVSPTVTLTGATVEAGGEITVSSGATAKNVVISSGGTVILESGGKLSGATVAQHGVIDLDSLNFTSGGTVHLVGNTLTVTEGGSTWSSILAGTFKSTDYFQLTKDADGSTLATFVCFCAGTLIRTEDGEEAVENLKIGDRVLTNVDGQAVPQSVKWVGRRAVKVRTDLALDEAGYPVRILKDAISEGVPHKDLLITAEHCLFFNGRFIPARMLVNGRSIFYDLTMTSYEHFHVETESHSVLWSNGALSESYLDTGNRLEFAQDGSLARLDTRAPKDWNVDAAAPLGVSRDFVEPIYRMLEARAVEKALPDQRDAVATTDDADLHLLTPAGHRIDAARHSENGQLVFMLPAGVDEVRIVSRTSRPFDMVGPMVDDRRHLGVLVGEVSLWADNGKVEITSHLTEEGLSGWNGLEAGGVRWTSGNGLLTLPERSASAIGVLTMTVTQQGPYAVEAETLKGAVSAS